MTADQTMDQTDLDEIVDEFLNHSPHRRLVESVSPTVGHDSVTFTAVNGSQCSISRDESFDATFDRLATWLHHMAKEAKREQERFAAFESAALGEW